MVKSLFDLIHCQVSLYRNVDDYMKLEEMLKHSRRIAIIGGGFLGSELACALAHNRCQTRFRSQILS